MKRGGSTSRANSPWNSLEIAKLALGALTPLALFFLGYEVNRESAEQAEARDISIQRAATSQRIFEKRVEFWEKLSVLAAHIDRLTFNVRPPNLHADELFNYLQRCQDLRITYGAFLSREFTSAFERYLRKLEGYIVSIRLASGERLHYQPNLGWALHLEYGYLRQAAGDEMSGFERPPSSQ